MGTEKRDRQRAARLDKVLAESAAAKRARNRRTGVRVAIATIVILAVLFGISRLMGNDSGNDPARASGDTTTSETEPPLLGATIPKTFADPTLAREVEARTPPKTTPPPKDTASDALVTKTLIKGEGRAAKTGDTITVHYVGKTPDGKTFDSSWTTQKPFPVTLGQGSVIQGWDEGLIGVKTGERRHLIIGADKAYGPNAQRGIPPNTPLAFDVDIIDVHPNPS